MPAVYVFMFVFPIGTSSRIAVFGSCANRPVVVYLNFERGTKKWIRKGIEQGLAGPYQHQRPSKFRMADLNATAIMSKYLLHLLIWRALLKTVNELSCLLANLACARFPIERFQALCKRRNSWLPFEQQQ